MIRLGELFNDGKKALAVYLTAGFPEPGLDEELAMAILEAGADILELGFPFSDPVADGPVIQESSRIALDNGTSLRSTLDLAGRIRERSEAPVVLMGYVNPVFRMGYSEFAAAAASAGVDGAIIPDLPMESSGELAGAMASRDMDLIPMAAPNTSDERLKQIVATGSGFLYLVSMAGLTGDQFQARAPWVDVARRSREICDLPVCVGFGIKTGADAASAAVEADGVIVGAAVITAIMESGSRQDALSRVSGLVSELAGAIKNGTG
jgi:tryptophan synthase alpha chain